MFLMKQISMSSLLIAILTFLAPFIFISNTIAYPEEGDCTGYHGITYIDIPVDNDALIILDGDPSENFWTENSNQKGKVEIKLAETKVGEEIPEIYTLNATFIMNSEYLYLLCQWIDNTPLYDYPPEKDGIAFCWNINTPNFSAYYVADMNTIHMGGGRVDAWRWVYSNFVSSGQEHLCGDDCFDENGWIDGNPEANSINVAYTNTGNSYTLEMKRKLITNEYYDVQFDEAKIYKFNVAILNDSYGVDHSISWTYALDLREPSNIIPFFQLNFIIILLLIAIILTKINFKKVFTNIDEN